MQLKPLMPDDVMKEIGDNEPTMDSDFCRQVREMVEQDIRAGVNMGWQAVMMPVDGDPIFVDGGDFDDILEPLYDERGIEVCYVIPCHGAIEKREDASGEGVAGSIKDDREWEARSPTAQFLKELHGSDLSSKEKDEQLKDLPWMMNGYVFVYAMPMRSAAWMWVPKANKFIFAGEDGNTLPEDLCNPFWLIARLSIQASAEAANQKNEWVFLKNTVRFYQLGKEHDRKPWRLPEITWQRTNMVMFNLELLAYQVMSGYFESSDMSTALASRCWYEDYRDVIMGGISMLDDLLSNRDDFAVCMSELSPQGLERAWKCISERTERVRQLMREVDERHAKKSGANN